MATRRKCHDLCPAKVVPVCTPRWRRHGAARTGRGAPPGQARASRRGPRGRLDARFAKPFHLAEGIGDRCAKARRDPAIAMSSTCGGTVFQHIINLPLPSGCSAAAPTIARVNATAIQFVNRSPAARTNNDRRRLAKTLTASNPHPVGQGWVARRRIAGVVEWS